MNDMETLENAELAEDMSTDDISFGFDDFDSDGDQDSIQDISLAPDQLDEDRSRDVSIVSKVCDIDERTARELLVRESWDHQKILELQWPSEGICTAASSTLNCPVCLESCTVGSSNGTQFFELCDHPMHTQCARDFIENEINLMAGLSKGLFKGSVTCPWCVALKAPIPGFLSERTVAALTSEKKYETYTKIRRSTLARNERHCPRQGCLNIVRFSSVKLNNSELCPTLECSCGYRFCLFCQSTEHWPASCQKVVDWVQMEARIQEDTLDLQRELEAMKQWERVLRGYQAMYARANLLLERAGEGEEAARQEVLELQDENFLELDQMLVDPDRFTLRYPTTPAAEAERVQGNGGTLPFDGSTNAVEQLQRKGKGCKAANTRILVYGSSTVAKPCHHNHGAQTTESPASQFGYSPSENPPHCKEIEVVHIGPEMPLAAEHYTECSQEAEICDALFSVKYSGEDWNIDDEQETMQELDLASGNDGPSSQYLDPLSEPSYLVGEFRYDTKLDDNEADCMLPVDATLRSELGRKRELGDGTQISERNKCHRRAGGIRNNFFSWRSFRSRLARAKKILRPKNFSECRKGSFKSLGNDNLSSCAIRPGEKMKWSAARSYSEENLAKSKGTGTSSKEFTNLAEDISVASLDGSNSLDEGFAGMDCSAEEKDLANFQPSGYNLGSVDVSIPTTALSSVRDPFCADIGNPKEEENLEAQATTEAHIEKENEFLPSKRFLTSAMNTPDAQLAKADSAMDVDEADVHGSELHESYIAKNIKDCPKCFCLCEKMEGCDHVRCPRCTHEFCWRCRTDWLLAGRYNHLQHCSGEALSIPTAAEAEEQYQAFLARAGYKETETIASKEEFMDEWLCREKQMRCDFDYGNYRGGRRRQARNADMAYALRMRERTNQLLLRLQEQERNLEMRKKYLISQSLKRGTTFDADSQADGSSAAQLEADYDRYSSVIAQWRSVERAITQNEALNSHSQDPPVDCCFYLSKILILCQTTLWAYKLHRFFDGHTPVDGLVEYSAMELERADMIYTILEEIVGGQTDADGDGSGSNTEPSESQIHTRESMTNCAEYYKRKRNNFTSAWEDAVLSRQGKSKGSQGQQTNAIA